MKHEDFERLAWEFIDGSMPPEDREHFEQHLKESQEARAELDELVALSELLSRAEEVEPPAELRPRIEGAVAATSPRWRRPPVTAELWRPRLFYLAAGLVVGALVARLLLPAPSVDREWVTGVMHAGPDHVAPGTLLVDLGHDGGALALWRDGAVLSANLGWKLAREVELVVAADSGDLWIRSAAHDAAKTSELEVDEGRVALRASGPGRFVIELGGAAVDDEIHVTVRSEGEILAERWVGPKNGGDQP